MSKMQKDNLIFGIALTIPLLQLRIKQPAVLQSENGILFKVIIASFGEGGAYVLKDNFETKGQRQMLDIEDTTRLKTIVVEDFQERKFIPVSPDFFDKYIYNNLVNDNVYRWYTQVGDFIE